MSASISRGSIERGTVHARSAAVNQRARGASRPPFVGSRALFGRRCSQHRARRDSQRYSNLVYPVPGAFGSGLLAGEGGGATGFASAVVATATVLLGP